MKARKVRAHLIIYAYMTAALWLAGCENEIPYNPGNQKPLLVMNALLNAGQADNHVYLHLSEGYKIKRVEQATLSLYVNGQLTEEPQPLESSQTGRMAFRLGTVFHPGDHLRLQATAEGEKYRAEAEVTVPQPVKDIQVDTCTTKIIRFGSMTDYHRILVTLSDLPDEKNYYRLEVLNNYFVQIAPPPTHPDEYGNSEYGNEGTSFYYTDRELINREDIILTDGHISHSDKDEENELFPSIKNKYNVFTDNQFANSTATLKVYTRLNPFQMNASPGMLPSLLSIDVRLFSLDREEYLYFKGLNTIDDENYDTALMEPVSLPSNVKGGLGFVGASSETRVTMVFP